MSDEKLRAEQAKMKRAKREREAEMEAERKLAAERAKRERDRKRMRAEMEAQRKLAAEECRTRQQLERLYGPKLDQLDEVALESFAAAHLAESDHKVFRFHRPSARHALLRAIQKKSAGSAAS